jgi:hypothetical protein
MVRKIKRRWRKRDTAANLRRRVQKRFPDQEVVVGEGRDGVKMSRVLEEFIEPYREFADTEEAFRKLLVTAVAAWNTALFPIEEREAHLQRVLKALPEEVRVDGRAIISELMEQKERYFSEYRRMIIDYEVVDTGEDYHLIVISTADELAEG